MPMVIALAARDCIAIYLDGSAVIIVLQSSMPCEAIEKLPKTLRALQDISRQVYVEERWQIRMPADASKNT
jgi:hypothetical protein